MDKEFRRLRSEDLPAFWRAIDEGAARLDRMQYGAPKKRPNGADVAAVEA